MLKKASQWLASVTRKGNDAAGKNEQSAKSGVEQPSRKDTSRWFTALISKGCGADGKNELTIEHVAETPGFIARTLLGTRPKDNSEAEAKICLQFPMQCAPDAMQKLRPDLNAGSTIHPEFTVRGRPADPGQVNL